MSFLQMSLAGAIMVLIVTVTRALFMHRIPKKTFVVLWGLVICRLLLPFDVAAPTSIFAIGRHVQGPVGPSMTFEAVDRSVLENMRDIYSWHYAQTMIEEQSAAAELAAPVLAGWSLVTTVWLAGAALLGLFFAVLYVRQRRKFLMSLPLENELIAEWLQRHKLRRRIRVRVSDRIATPLTYGVFSPVILLPKHMNWADEKGLSHILAHELIHIKRFDGLKKLLLAAVLCVHWFNPLVWLMYMLFNRDLEISCDEGVIRQFGEEAKPQYAITLISAQEQGAYPPLHNAFSKYAIEERIHAIMRSRRASFFGILVAFVLVAGIAMVFATSATAEVQEEMSARIIVLTDVSEDDALISAEEAATIGRVAFSRYFAAFAGDWDDWEDITFLMTFSPWVNPHTLREWGVGANGAPVWQGLVVVDNEAGMEHIFPFSFFVHAETGEVLRLQYTPRTAYALLMEAVRLDGDEAIRALFRTWSETHPGLGLGKYDDMFIGLAAQAVEAFAFLDCEIVAIYVQGVRAMASGPAGTVVVEYAGGDFVKLEFLLVERELVAVQYILG
ncbi:MAG: M56 family metallopeptidase [Oscillospiraceae bacterium]|nr:M56 family metallopeptidase [Oscillospiraceae bacterium]